MVGLCVAAVLLAPQVVQADSGDDQTLQEKIKQLERRVAELEGRSTQEVAVAKADIPQKTLDFLGQTELSGFVSASYLYNFAGKNPVGRTFDVNNDQFTFNKFKLMLEKPVDYNPTNWVVGYRAGLIFGQDASVIHSGDNNAGTTFNLGTDGDLEEAFIAVNVPVGNGLKVIFGKMVTLMGVEVIEEVANPNLSEGNQFLFVENFTQTGLQLAYKWNDKFDTEFVVFNGWDALPDNNTGKSFMGRIGWTIDDKESLGLIGYGGPEQPGNSTNWRTGTDIVFNRKWTDKLNMWLQGDYGHEENAFLSDGVAQTPNADWWAGGLWLTYDFTDKIGLAARGDYLKDKDGVRTGSTFGLAPGVGQELYSATLTLNLKPVTNLQVRPEFRWDRSSNNNAFNGYADQFTAGIGVAYLY
jgi:hypothetical protein